MPSSPPSAPPRDSAAVSACFMTPAPWPLPPPRHHRHPDLAAAVRYANIFLTCAPESLTSVTWYITDCRGGYVLLLTWGTRQVTAYNPLTRALDVFPVPPDEMADGCDSAFVYHGCHVVSSNESPGSFRVVSICHDESRARAAVFSSSTREWQILPPTGYWPAEPSGDRLWHAKQAFKLVLDTATLQFWIDLPEQLKGQGHTYMAGKTSDGKLCIISATEFTLHIWFRRADADGVEKWMHDNVISLEEEVLRATEGSWDGHFALKVLAILDGIGYLRTFETFRDAASPCWFMTFSLETRKLEKLFNMTFHHCDYPYIMVWPPSLVRSDVSP